MTWLICFQGFGKDSSAGQTNNNDENKPDLNEEVYIFRY